MLDLGKDTQEGPIRYFGSQASSGSPSVAISSISQPGTNVVTVICSTPHGAIPGSQVTIVGTTWFNGTYTVDTVVSSLVYTFLKVPATHVENTGFSTVYLTGVISTMTFDQSYTFQYDHDIGSDISLLTDNVAYTPSVIGTSYAPYITGTAEGRVFAQDVINKIVALGINIEIIVVYPDDSGLGNNFNDITILPDKLFVWGID
jgi:hypothetical protein